jgi:hypothetical protein
MSKINFKKEKKYFDAFSNEKQFVKQSLRQYQIGS